MPVTRYPTPRSLFRSLVVAVAAAACGTLLGCAGSSHIQESQLSITPTEATTSFSRTSQGVIAELGITPDQLGNPSDLEHNASLSLASPSGRSLVLSESWYLRGQNDLDVPIATSLDRYLRAAHFAYDALFAENSCGTPHPPICGDLLTAYNRAVREVARVTNNGTLLPASDPNTYALEIVSPPPGIDPREWELTLDDVPAHPTTTFGSSGAGCQMLTTTSSEQGAYLRRCTPIAFVVTFDKRAHDGPARAEISLHTTLTERTLSLHGTDITLPLDLGASWTQLLSSSTHPIEAGCLAPVEPALPTVMLSLPSSAADLQWAPIAATLSADPAFHDRFNFCVVTPNSPGVAVGGLQGVVRALSALSSTPPEHPTIILVAQGSEGEALLRGLKDELRAQRRPGSSPELVLAGSLVVPTPHHAPKTDSIALNQGMDLSKHDQGALNDIKRLLTRLLDSDDGVLGSTRRSTVSLSPGMNLSPVM